MKRLILSAVAAVGLLGLFVSSANAISVFAKYDSFVSRSATVAGVGSGGGIGSFTVTTPPAATGDALLDNLLATGNQFLAMCLEPDQYIYNDGSTYEFEIVDLALAPTSSAAGPMGASGQKWIERILANTDYKTMDELIAGATISQEYIFQAALYEAGYEDPSTASFAFNAGTAVVTSGGTSADRTAHISQANSGLMDHLLGNINSYGLLNVQKIPNTQRTAYAGQDFMVFTRSTPTVPSPGPLALLAIGLLGLGFTSLRGKSHV